MITEPARPIDRLLQTVLGSLARWLYRVRVEGAAQIPDSGPVLLLCNHVTLIDWIFVACALGRPPRFVIHKRYYDNWLFWPILRLARVIPILSATEDQKVRDQALERIASALQGGALVCLFPEGRLTPDGHVLPLRPGFERILERNPVPTVIVVLDGLFGSFFSLRGGPPMRKLPLPWRARVRIACLACLHPDDASVQTVRTQMCHGLTVQRQE